MSRKTNPELEKLLTPAQVNPTQFFTLDMGRDSEAFGIFSRNRQGPEAGIGQGSEYRSGYLVLWQGPYFATVYTDRQIPALWNSPTAPASP